MEPLGKKVYKPLPRGERVCAWCGYRWYNEPLKDDVFECSDCRFQTKVFCEHLTHFSMWTFELRCITVDMTELNILNWNLREIIAGYLKSAPRGYDY